MVAASHLPEPSTSWADPIRDSSHPPRRMVRRSLLTHEAQSMRWSAAYRDQQSATRHSAGPRRPTPAVCASRTGRFQETVKAALSVVARRLEPDSGERWSSATGQRQRPTHHLVVSPQGDLAEAPRVDRFPPSSSTSTCPAALSRSGRAPSAPARRQPGDRILRPRDADAGSLTQRAIGVLGPVVALDARPLEQERWSSTNAALSCSGRALLSCSPNAWLVFGIDFKRLGSSGRQSRHTRVKFHAARS